MQPVLLPLFDRAMHASLLRAGVVSRHVHTSLGNVHYYDAAGRGAGNTIVLLHGLSANAGSYAPMIGRLRRRARRVIAVDLPGHGRSDEVPQPLTPDLLFEGTTAALDAILGDERCILIGNSLGGACAAKYASRRPERVSALVLLSPAGAEASSEELDELRRVFAVTSRRDALAFLERVHHQLPAMLHLVAHEMPAVFARRAVRDLLATSTPADGVEAAELERLTMPILLWWGESERIFPDSHLAWYRAHLPGHAVVERPPAVGHCPQLDDPRALDARLAVFVGA